MDVTAYQTKNARIKPIELEAVKYDGIEIPVFAQGKTVPDAIEQALRVNTDEGERVCEKGDYFVLTDNGQLLVRGGGIFETIFEPVGKP